MEVTKAGNITGGKIRQLEEHCPDILINWQQISKMTKYLKKYIRDAVPQKQRSTEVYHSAQNRI